MSDRVKQTQRIETVQQYNTCHQDRHYYLQVVSTFTQRYSRVCSYSYSIDSRISLKNVYVSRGLKQASCTM